MCVCVVCGASFEAKRPATARYCGATCRQRKRRGAGPTDTPAPVVSGTVEPIGVVAAVAAELSAAGRLNTSLGQQALKLAVRLETSKTDTGAGLASLSKELRALMVQALAGVTQVDDPVDEIAKRRDEKLKRAAG